VRNWKLGVFKEARSPKIRGRPPGPTNPKEKSNMPFSTVSKKNGKTYILHSRQQTLRGGQTVTLYYFASEAGAGAMDKLPDGYAVTENDRTGLPLLKKNK
jgi:hypothetical protein